MVVEELTCALKAAKLLGSFSSTTPMPLEELEADA
jgi:hypothetical protein